MNIQATKCLSTFGDYLYYEGNDGFQAWNQSSSGNIQVQPLPGTSGGQLFSCWAPALNNLPQTTLHHCVSPASMKASLGPAVWVPSMPLLGDWLGLESLLYFESNKKMSLSGSKLATWQRMGARFLLAPETCQAEVPSHHATESKAIRTVQTVVPYSIIWIMACLLAQRPTWGLGQCSHWSLRTPMLD